MDASITALTFGALKRDNPKAADRQKLRRWSTGRRLMPMACCPFDSGPCGHLERPAPMDDLRSLSARPAGCENAVSCSRQASGARATA